MGSAEQWGGEDRSSERRAKNARGEGASRGEM